MNYRHHFHAGNFADVMKHALLLQLVRALQKKPKGLFALDTHAGRGSYDLEVAQTGDSLARQAEWPAGIGRLWTTDAAALPAPLADYVTLVRDFDRRAGNVTASPRFYPGSPAILAQLARPVDRLALWEKHPEECAALRMECGTWPRVAVQEADGYGALRACLPPPERRAVVLIDPPFEAQDEFARVAAALREGLRRMPGALFAVWYPLTQRARADEFLAVVRDLRPPPTLACELTIAGPGAVLKMKGCGLLVINPPWQFEVVARTVLDPLVTLLAQAPGGVARVDWIVREAAPAPAAPQA
jgi:23S rRNA (adenine2030-N6)-methyltransferase